MKIFTLAVVAFLLHLVWENVQAPLYANYQSLPQHFPACLVGTIGDVAITLFVLAFFRLLKKSWPRTIADFSALAIAGFLIAIMIEQRALPAGKWNYAPEMPIIPWLNVGLTPILQMAILLPLSFYAVRKMR